MARTLGSAGRKYLLTILALIALSTGQLLGQRGGPPQPRATPRESAPIDLTGYWVSLVTEDWRYRISTPPRGDYIGVPLSPAGRKAADAWDPKQASTPTERCKPYGAAGVMRMPGRLRITWQGDDTLKVETDAGAQTRLLSFRTQAGRGGGWQGVSVAAWERGDTVMTRGGFFPGPSRTGGSLRVVTTGMRPGYLRRNGVPYSAQAVMTEYFDRLDVPDGDSLVVVSTEVVDPAYLVRPFWTSTHFKKQNDATGWNPRPCQ